MNARTYTPRHICEVVVNRYIINILTIYNPNNLHDKFKKVCLIKYYIYNKEDPLSIKKTNMSSDFSLESSQKSTGRKTGDKSIDDDFERFMNDVKKKREKDKISS